ncbi:histidine kinase N-terminal 7TM domain-containing protein [Natrinema sp. SYSU A 869]|uniref:histidine kinase N-terminal 7TM domain-containing protein n=1 Tax=Natrinema sp. SYSU A 869 TaxID=2871694 RepID=UPI001CA400D2|nr:histidine kinase N-terminal 7TM domain-containing protein [Natrinema sp. SYSU A 869]
MLYIGHLAGLVVTALISIVVAWWVRRQTHDRAGTVMIALLSAHALQAAFATFQMLSSNPATQAFWFQLWFFIGIVNPVIWLLLAVYYTGREYWLTKPVWALLLASPAVPGILWFINPGGFMVSEFVVLTEPFHYVRPEFTAASVWLVGLINIYTVFGFGLFLQMFLFTERSTRWQAAAVLAGMLSIFVSTMFTNTGFVPAPGFPYGLYGGGFYGVIIAMGLFRTRMFAVSPLARDAIFESLEDAILVVDANRTIVDFNDRADTLFPDLDDHVGYTLEDIYPALVKSADEPTADGGGAEAIVERIEGTLESPFSGTVRVSVEGETRTLRISASAIASGGEPRGYALIMRDISELEEYATELERKTDQLEQFASVLSHDLRNPVSVALGYAQQAQATDDVDHVADVLIALERIEDTIDNLLMLSREGESIDDPEVVALRDVVADAWTTSDTGTAAFENKLGDDLVRTDPSRLQTVFENLFRNAVEHGGETVQVGPLERGFYVADDGPGIPEAERGCVFEYGYSGDGGTGLGLAIVSSIADAHGWSLSLTDSEAGGARFTISEVDFVPPDEHVPREGSATVSNG